MRFKRPHSAPFIKGDLTPMIDMTFQLIAFFMVLINFTEAEQDQRIKLPSSELAKPPDAPFEVPITIQLTKEGDAIFSGARVSIDGLYALLLQEKQILDRTGKTAKDATIILRGHAEAKTGALQDVIKTCQELEYENFVLRAKQEESVRPVSGGT